MTDKKTKLDDLTEIVNENPVKSVSLLLILPITAIIGYIFSNTVFILSSIILGYQFTGSMYHGSMVIVMLVTVSMVAIYNKKIVDTIFNITYFISDKIVAISKLREAKRQMDSLVDDDLSEFSHMSEFSDSDE